MNFPSLGNSPTKESILEILSEEWPISAKKIYKILTNSYALSITYQATHKALQELVEKKILIKNNDGYSLNKEWINNLGKFSKKIEDKLEDINQNKEVKTMQKIIFKIHTDFIKFNFDLIKDIIKKGRNVDILFQFRHIPYVQVIPNEEINMIKELMPKIKWKILSKFSTPLDKWNAKQWNQIGVKTEFDPNISADRMIILNDLIIQAYMSKEAIKQWDDIYSIKDMNKFNIESMAKGIFNPKFKTIVTIFEDKDLARILKSY